MRSPAARRSSSFRRPSRIRARAGAANSTRASRRATSSTSSIEIGRTPRTRLFGMIIIRRQVRLFDCKTLAGLKGLAAHAVMRGDLDSVLAGVGVALGGEAENSRYVALGVERLAAIRARLRLAVEHLAAGRQYRDVVTDVDGVGLSELVAYYVEERPNRVSGPVSRFRQRFPVVLPAVEADIANHQRVARVHTASMHLEGYFARGRGFAHQIGERDGGFISARIGQWRDRDLLADRVLPVLVLRS